MNKPQLESLNHSSGASFLVNNFVLEKFTVPYHFHPEFELTLIIAGKGKRYVGKNMQDFGPGDLVLLGADLPHCWKSEGEEEPDAHAESIVVQFEKDFLGRAFFDKPELTQVNNLLKTSSCGICFQKNTADTAAEKMAQLAREEGAFRKMMLLLDILDFLARSDEYVLLDHSETVARQLSSDKERINKAMGYIVENFRSNIVLKEVAAVVSMSPNAFCRYFKKASGKTFFETVIDYRINFAVQQLLSTEKAVSDIALESGFNDVSHFYKLFRKRMKVSPLSYRKNFHRGL
ncbi:AraC family transcriptional regulator [Dyadobacter sandarakinus]|uniref:AraC family transcriptional regulator n=1 Tax=Dyadobacter sandarakinus TaxID=2747268 RepID=A0ABX7IAG4_9BACT|nr:AraC family transcriptional regulator [Dyadobacter sandarakinus]QRR02975.1 AraC family transcriptional regulator [Dyadobacter sandarakinus]